MEQPADSPESSLPDGAEPSTSRVEGGASVSKHKEEERLDSMALINTANRGELAKVKEIIDGMKTNGVDINHKCSNGLTAVIWVCFNGHKEVALELLKVDGLDINTQDRYRWTALIRACSNGYADAALALLRDPRVNRHIKNRHGSNALAVARNKGLTAVVTRFKALGRGDERMPVVKVRHRYLHGDVAAEGAQAQSPHPPESVITKALVDKNLMHYISRFLAP